ncbi:MULTISPECIES: alpha/beta fold hydrolase [unclassified Rhodococcus (in: high G+C Gram-positive bacteria)]|uniref:alpha/beta fold hydrolase n=1 Tax=unclassified Rhodococcus (in: high G+C Gram-positive bacteria) TaxID=192944 RepID=UPI00163ADA62|nr:MULTISPECIES: alpha/beta hydrolase [unclassified Rhodococcus (in: high G+C Gram-positive bacteria)]MBC2639432.1 alpha/beta hydrolase [Rhodococcus sp. 3A]MBC2895823.1 alpha/beta hydrolase [Rhodococcus sp. 4CII]
MAIRETVGVDGTPLVYSVTGAPDARALVLLHGWAQSSKCWGAEVLGELAARYRVIAVDLRGHGYSDAPDSGYDDSAIWAGDVDAVLTAEDVTSGAVLLGWSYGGLVICDYLASHGTSAVDGVVLVGAITSIGRGEAGGKVGAAMRAAIPGAMSEEPRDAIRALGAFGTALTGPPEGKGAQSQALFGASLATPPRVRAALFNRSASHDDLLRSLDVPALVLHGTEDSVVDVSAGRHAVELIPRARASFWDGCDHAPFVEDPERFVKEVGEFVDNLG